MALTSIILLIVLGIIFLLLEVLVIPGVGVVGFIGFILMLVGVFYAYQIDNMTGHAVLGSTLLVSAMVAWLSMRSKTWDRLSLSTEVDGKSPNLAADAIQVGDTGVAVSRIAPMGKAKINGKLVEVSSTGALIDEHTNVVVIKVKGINVIVQPEKLS